jgi:chorismate mutase
MNDTALMAMGQPAADQKVTMNTAPQEVLDLGKFREEIDKLDAKIVRLVQHRTRISRSIGATRMATGGPRIVYKQEMAVLARFRELEPEGSDLAMVLLRLGRGRPGVQRNDLLSVLNTVPAVHHTSAAPSVGVYSKEASHQ